MSKEKISTVPAAGTDAESDQAPAPPAAPSLLPPINGAVTVPAGAADAYESLRASFDRTMAGMREDRVGLQQQLKACMDVVSARSAEYDAALLAVTEAQEKVDASSARINSLAEEDQKRVHAAQAEFDRLAAAGDDEKALQKAAEQLHAARAQQQAGSIMQGGLKLRLTAQEEMLASRQQEQEQALACCRDAWEDVRRAELALALLDSDEAMNVALAGYLRVHQLQMMLPERGRPFLFGVGDVSFWFSARDRAVRWNSMLSSPGQQDGPVAVSRHALGRLEDEVRLPAGSIVPAMEA